ncbi:hypothetical protein ABVT39_025972 [Epinephelus coioides]
MKEIEGLKTIQALAQCHAEILRTKLHKVCLVLIEQVKNLGSAAACSAMNTVAELYGHLQRAMDLEVEGTGQALLLKLASNNFIQQQANLALDAIVANCSHGHILSALFNTRLSLYFIFLNLKLNKRIPPQAPRTNSPPGPGPPEGLPETLDEDRSGEREKIFRQDLKKRQLIMH